MNTIYRKKTSLLKLTAKQKNDYIWAYLLILPTVLGIGVFYIYAFLQNVFYSFTDLSSFGKYSFVMLDNYKKLFADPDVGAALVNTFEYTAISVPASVIIATLVAVLLNSKIKGIAVYRTLYFLPAVTMPAAIAMVWKWLYNSKFGLINEFLRLLGIKGQAWISDPKLAMGSLIVVAVWCSIGFNMIIILAGLQGIPKSYYEAAEIDGAGPIRQFFNITLPLLTPTLFFVTIMALIESFQVFDMIFMMISENGMAIKSTMSIVYLFYKNAFILDNKGYASAIAILIFMIILMVTIIQLRLQKKWVNY